MGGHRERDIKKTRKTGRGEATWVRGRARNAEIVTEGVREETVTQMLGGGGVKDAMLKDRGFFGGGHC